jgi:hypothetical protein
MRCPRKPILLQEAALLPLEHEAQLSQLVKHRSQSLQVLLKGPPIDRDVI